MIYKEVFIPTLDFFFPLPKDYMLLQEYFTKRNREWETVLISGLAYYNTFIVPLNSTGRLKYFIYRWLLFLYFILRIHKKSIGTFYILPGNLSSEINEFI